jgi:DNA-binding NarL/FixJ family response regulator
LRQAVEQRQRRNAAIAITGLAALAAEAGNSKQAARLCGSTSALIEQVGAAMTIGGQRSYDRASQLARAALGDAAFEREWTAGREFSPEAVLLGEGSDSPVRPVGLTRRELEVLQSLTEGRSNREIAETLFISERTVANHVASILAKLGLHSRSAAASYAVRSQLV